MTPTHELQSPAPSLESKKNKKKVFLEKSNVESHYNLKDISVKTTNVPRKLKNDVLLLPQHELLFKLNRLTMYTTYGTVHRTPLFVCFFKIT